MPTVYVDGCAFQSEQNGQKVLVAGIGNAWAAEPPIHSQGYKLGSYSSQIAELMAVHQAIVTAAQHSINELVIVTDSTYVRNGFVEYLPGWKNNGMLCGNGKPLKHARLIIAIDDLVTANNMTIYWKKTKGHSKIEGEEKQGNDHADQLANYGALNGDLIDVEQFFTVPAVAAVTRLQAKAQEEEAVVQWVGETPDNDLVTAQVNDKTLGPFYKHLEDPEAHPLTPDSCGEDTDLRTMLAHNAQFLIQDRLLVRKSKSGVIQWVVPRSHRGIMMAHAHNEITAGHRGAEKTYQILKELAYWPHMFQDIVTYTQGCLTCAQFQPTQPRHRAPLQKRGIVYPWSDIQIDFIGPVPRSSRGNKYMLTVTCLFTKWVECLPATNCKAETAALLLLNHVFCRLGLPQRIASDRGSHFTSDVMTKIWETLGVKRQLHVAYRPASSGSVERYNQTIVSILKKYVNETGTDWDIKLPLVLMAIRATPAKGTSFSPFELLTGRKMTVPMHLLYKTNEPTLVGASTVHDYVAGLRKHLQFAFAHAQKCLERSVDSIKTYYDLRTTKKEYEVGNKVFVFNFARTQSKERKFLPAWRGPFLITDKLSPVMYKIQLKKGNQTDEKWMHINQIKVAHPRSRLAEIENDQTENDEERVCDNQACACLILSKLKV